MQGTDKHRADLILLFTAFSQPLALKLIIYYPLIKK